MPDWKRVICLANSRKFSGRCVAGREWTEGQRVGNWIRPVSGRESQEVSKYERQYRDGSDPQVLDIIDIPVLGPQPGGYQVENWLLDPECCWVKAGTFDCSRLSELLDPDASLWIDGHRTTYGLNDRIPLDEASSIRGSLKLLHVEKLTLQVSTSGEAFGDPKRRVRGRFRHMGVEYALWLTDSRYERAYKAKPDGTYSGFRSCVWPPTASDNQG